MHCSEACSAMQCDYINAGGPLLPPITAAGFVVAQAAVIRNQLTPLHRELQSCSCATKSLLR